MSKAEDWERLAARLKTRFERLRIGQPDSAAVVRDFTAKALQYMEFIHHENQLRTEFLQRSKYREALLEDDGFRGKLSDLRPLCEGAIQAIRDSAPEGAFDAKPKSHWTTEPRSRLELAERFVAYLAETPHVGFKETYSQEWVNPQDMEPTWANAIHSIRVAAKMAGISNPAVDDAIRKAEKAVEEMDRSLCAEWRAEGRRAMKELSEVYNAWIECIPDWYDCAEVESLIEDVHGALLEWIEDQRRAAEGTQVTNEQQGRRGERGTSPTPQRKPKLRKPEDDYIEIWRINFFHPEMKQDAIAKMFQEQSHKPCDQSKVSRAIKRVQAYVDAGNVLPGVKSKTAKRVTMDPEAIEYGKRQDKGRKAARKRSTDAR